MAEETIDQKLNAPQAEKQEEKKEVPKKVSTLESAVNETFHAAGNLVKLGLAAGVPYAQATAFPHLARDTAVLAGAQVAGDATTNLRKGQKYTAGNTLESSLLGTAVTAPLYYFFNFMNKIPLDSPLGYLSRGSLWAGVGIPGFIGTYQFLDYIIKNRTLKGVGKYIKENYWPTLKRTWKYILPFSLANVFFVPAALQIPVSAALSYIFALFGAPKKGEVPAEKKRDTTPWYKAASNVIYKAGSSIFNAPYNIGRAIYELAKPTPKAEAPKAPAAQPAAQPA